MGLHLLKSARSSASSITTYTGPKNPEVSRVGWSDGTVWLDAGKTNARERHRATEARHDRLSRACPRRSGTSTLAATRSARSGSRTGRAARSTDEDVGHYQKIVVALNETIRIMAEIDEVIEAHGGWPDAFQTASEADAASVGTANVVPFRPRTVEPAPEDRYVTCVPLVPLRAAAGGFSDPQYIEDDEFEWVALESRHRLRKGMFVAQVVGKSMEPAILDGGWCLFRAPVGGTRQGKVSPSPASRRHRSLRPDSATPSSATRAKRRMEGDSWRHEKITLEPVNPDFEPIVLTGAEEGELQVIAELVEVLGG